MYSRLCFRHWGYKDKKEFMHPCGNCDLLKVEVGGNVFRKRFLQNYEKLKSQIEWQIEESTENSFRRWNVLWMVKYTKDSFFFGVIGSWVQRDRERKREIRMWVWTDPSSCPDLDFQIYMCVYICYLYPVEPLVLKSLAAWLVIRKTQLGNLFPEVFSLPHPHHLCPPTCAVDIAIAILFSQWQNKSLAPFCTCPGTFKWGSQSESRPLCATKRTNISLWLERMSHCENELWVLSLLLK